MNSIHRIAIDNIITLVYNLVEAKFIEATGQLEPRLPI